MSRTFITPRDRVLFCAIGAWAIIQATLMILDPTSPARVWLWPLWALMLGAGGVLTFAFAATLRSFRLRAWSNTLMVVACAGRGCGFILTLADRSGGPSAVTSMVGSGGWMMLAALLYLVWRSRLPLPEGIRVVSDP